MILKEPADMAGLKVATETETTADIYMKDLIADGLNLVIIMFMIR